MYFRPYFWLSVCALPALIILILLGSWQVQRLNWKTGLIDEYRARALAPAIALPDADISLDNFRFQRLALTGRFLNDKEIYINGRTYEGNAGFHVITPFLGQDGRIVLVNRGWVSEAYRLPSARPFSISDEIQTIEAIIRAPQRKGYFVPENEPERGFWFTINPAEIGSYQNVDSAITSFYVDQIRSGEVITLPIAADLKVDVPNAHLNYALTWYGIALSLIGVYIAYHVNAGRLGIGTRPRE